MLTRTLFALLAVLGLLLPPAVHAQSTGPNAAWRIRLPLVSLAGLSSTCPATGTGYATIPVIPPPADRVASQHADLNLGLRGYQPVNASLKLVDYGGGTDANPPQLHGLFGDRRTPGFTSAHQVYNWNWGCGSDGCRGAPVSSPQVTLLGVAVRPGERLYLPSRAPEIYGGGYTALVLYAEEERITLKYTREDNVVGGYTVQIEGLCVDPNLLRLYRQANAAGRGSLPGIKNGQAVGTASSGEVRAAVRDCGAYLDPRSRKDWWQ